jgi:hypothetical protein
MPVSLSGTIVRTVVVRAALDARQPRQRLDQRIVDRLLGEWALLAEAADRHIDDGRRQRPHRLLTEAHAVDHPGAEVLDEDIRRGDQPLQCLHTGRRLQVQHNRALVAVVVEE